MVPLSFATKKRFSERSAGAAALALAVLLQPGCGLRRIRNADLVGTVNSGDQPDKILYERAMNEINHGRFDVGRLTLQTLLNTYPDSEYLAKAKLAIADSYYREGGVSGLTEAEQEYKDFITFFPTAPEAPEAQFRTGMAHFRLMGKADRDRTEAKLAEAEFKEFLLKYPDSEIMPKVKGRLRQVQEVLAEGEFRIASFYYLKHANRAAQSRFQDIADNYPNYSQADRALWYLGQTLERMKIPQGAAPYYARIITDYPLSSVVPDAKTRLTALHQPIPKPTRAMLARAEADRTHSAHRDLFERLAGMLSSAPDVTATRRGPVQLGGPKPGEVMAAKTPQAPTGPGNVVVAEPVPDSALESAKPAAAASDNASSGDEHSAGTEKTVSSAEANSNTADKTKAADPTAPYRKKSKKSLLKKLIKPF